MKILVAEDEEGIAMTYELALRARGHEVTLTTNGKLCLDEYGSGNAAGPAPFDVVILDYRMPVMDGYETARRILKINPQQRIIFASAFGRETLESMIKNVGIIAEILQKPFDLDVLVDSVEDHYVYSKLQALKINIGDLKSWNPTHQQLTDLHDALLRLRNPKTVFAQLLNESEEEDVKNEKLRNAPSGGKQQQGDENKECRVVTAIVEDALGYLGPEWLSIFFFHLDHLGVHRDNIADKPDQFIEALEKLLGSASSMVRMQIVRSIESNQDVIGNSGKIVQFKSKLAEVACLPSTAESGGSSGGRNS